MAVLMKSSSALPPLFHRAAEKINIKGSGLGVSPIKMLNDNSSQLSEEQAALSLLCDAQPPGSPSRHDYAITLGPVRTCNTVGKSKIPSKASLEKDSKRRQGIFWMLTVPSDRPSLLQSIITTNTLPDEVEWIRGQEELGAGGFKHYQAVVAFCKKVSLNGVTSLFGKFHAELTKSIAADEYVWKDDTRIGERFELGAKPIQRNDKADWESVWRAAKLGDLEQVPANIRVVSYRTLRTIRSDYARCEPIVRSGILYFGPTGTGKSRRAWNEAGMDAYGKCPRTKFWDGYMDDRNVVMDEFRGGIDISHLLRWLDRYPVRLEVKGSYVRSKMERLWITSNLHPREWYQEVDPASRAALFRRIKLVEMKEDGMLLWTCMVNKHNTLIWDSFPCDLA